MRGRPNSAVKARTRWVGWACSRAAASARPSPAGTRASISARRRRARVGSRRGSGVGSSPRRWAIRRSTTRVRRLAAATSSPGTASTSCSAATRRRRSASSPTYKTAACPPAHAEVHDLLLRDQSLSSCARTWPGWQALNVTAFLVSGITAATPELVGDPYRDADDTEYLPMLGQPVVVLAADGATLRRAHGKALERNLRPAVFTADLFTTGNDADNRAAVRAVARADLDLVGLAVHGPRNAVDKIVKGSRTHPDAGAHAASRSASGVRSAAAGGAHAGPAGRGGVPAGRWGRSRRCGPRAPDYPYRRAESPSARQSARRPGTGGSRSRRARTPSAGRVPERRWWTARDARRCAAAASRPGDDRGGGSSRSRTGVHGETRRGSRSRPCRGCRRRHATRWSSSTAPTSRWGARGEPARASAACASGPQAWSSRSGPRCPTSRPSRAVGTSSRSWSANPTATRSVMASTARDSWRPAPACAGPVEVPRAVHAEVRCRLARRRSG